MPAFTNTPEPTTYIFKVTTTIDPEVSPATYRDQLETALSETFDTTKDHITLEELTYSQHRESSDVFDGNASLRIIIAAHQTRDAFETLETQVEETLNTTLQTQPDTNADCIDTLP